MTLEDLKTIAERDKEMLTALSKEEEPTFEDNGEITEILSDCSTSCDPKPVMVEQVPMKEILVWENVILDKDALDPKYANFIEKLIKEKE